MGKGATGAQNQIAGQQQNFMSTLQSDFGTSFAGQQNIINGLTKSLNNTLQGGPSQYGFSTPETTALNTLATSGNAQQYQNARAAVGEAAAASGGGANLPTGSQLGVQADLAEKAAQNESNSLLGIQEAGYKQGAANYNEAVSGLTSAASLENPSGVAGQANNAGENAFGSATTIQKTNQAASPWGQVGGLVGSLAGSALNAFLPGAGSVVSGLTGGLSRTMCSSAQQLDSSSFGPAVGDTFTPDLFGGSSSPAGYSSGLFGGSGWNSPSNGQA